MRFNERTQSTGGRPMPALLLALLAVLLLAVGLRPTTPARADSNGVEATLTITKTTDPAGGTGFPFTIDPGPYTFAFKWGTLNFNPNPPPGTFDEPIGIAIFGNNVYVADTDNDRVQQFDAAGNFIRQWGVTGSGPGGFILPWGIAVDSSGRVYVADTENHRVQRFSATGVYQTQWGGNGSGAGQFNRPYALAAAPDGSIYVVDTDNHRIQKFTAGGAFVLAFGKDVVNGGGTGFEICLTAAACQTGQSGNGDGELNVPTGVAVDAAGAVYVVDGSNHRVQKFDANGNYLDQWGTQGGGNGQFFFPFGITTDAAGNVYVSDQGNNRIQKFTGDGDYLTQWGGPGGGDGQFNSVRGVAVTSSGNVYTADTGNHRIQVFTPELSVSLDDTQSMDFFLPFGEYLVSELVPDGWEVDDISCTDGSPIYNGATATVTLSDATPSTTCTFTNTEAPEPSAAIFVSTTAAGTTGDGLAFGPEDVIRWDGNEWTTWFDGSAAGLMPFNAKHNLNAFWIPDPAGNDLLLSFAQNRRFVPGITNPVDGMDLVMWNGASFSFWFDGSDVGLTNLTAEKIDALHVLPGSESPIGGSCDVYLLVSTQGVGKVPNHSGGTLNFGGEDVLGFCATNLGSATAGVWHKVIDGSDQGMPRNATDSISLSADGETLYLTTKGTFNVDGATGGHSMVYAYDIAGQTFSGPHFVGTDAGLDKKVDGLDMVALP